MHPAFLSWWKSAHCASECRPGADAGGGSHSHGHSRHQFWASPGDWGGGGPFGVRRPLRFLAYKLELDERQVEELARILDELKTERAQADVDSRRTLTALADAVT